MQSIDLPPAALRFLLKSWISLAVLGLIVECGNDNFLVGFQEPADNDLAGRAFRTVLHSFGIL